MKSLVIFRKELIGYFLSPIAWIVAVSFALVAAAFFVREGLYATHATLDLVYSRCTFAFVVTFPALTMGALAGEFRTGTIETLATDPVRDSEIVLGKYLGVMAFFAMLVSPLVLFYALLRFGGATPDPGPVVSGLVGILLAGSLCAAVGLFASALSSNQVLAFVVAFLILLVLRLLGSAEAIELPPEVSKALVHVSFPPHLSDFLRGLVTLEDVTYFVSTTALFLFLATRVLESRRWA